MMQPKSALVQDILSAGLSLAIEMTLIFYFLHDNHSANLLFLPMPDRLILFSAKTSVFRVSIIAGIFLGAVAACTKQLSLFASSGDADFPCNAMLLYLFALRGVLMTFSLLALLVIRLAKNRSTAGVPLLLFVFLINLMGLAANAMAWSSYELTICVTLVQEAAYYLFWCAALCVFCL
mgnify:CR=1 FL=1